MKNNRTMRDLKSVRLEKKITTGGKQGILKAKWEKMFGE